MHIINKNISPEFLSLMSGVHIIHDCFLQINVKYQIIKMKVFIKKAIMNLAFILNFTDWLGKGGVTTHTGCHSTTKRNSRNKKILRKDNTSLRTHTSLASVFLLCSSSSFLNQEEASLNIPATLLTELYRTFGFLEVQKLNL